MVQNNVSVTFVVSTPTQLLLLARFFRTIAVRSVEGDIEVLVENPSRHDVDAALAVCGLQVAYYDE